VEVPESSVGEGLETVDVPQQTRWQQRGNKVDGDDQTGVEGLEAFSSHPNLSKQWNFFRGVLNLREDFPHKNLMVRVGSNLSSNDQPSRNREQIPHRVLYLSDALHDIISDPRNRDLKLINVGLPVLLSGKPTMYGLHYRLAQEGVPSFFPYIRSRVVTIGIEDFRVLLMEGDPFLSKLSVQSQQSLRFLEPGPCVFQFRDNTTVEMGDVVIAGFRGQNSARIQMKDTEKALMFQLFVGDEPSDNEKDDKNIKDGGNDKMDIVTDDKEKNDHF
jgi:hypothetical protein